MSYLLQTKVTPATGKQVAQRITDLGLSQAAYLRTLVIADLKKLQKGS